MPTTEVPIEQSPEEHLSALEELPPEAIISARIVLTAESAERVADLRANPPELTDALKALFADG